MNQASLKEGCFAAHDPKICLMVGGIKVNRRIELHMDVLKVNIRISSKLMFSSDKATEVGRTRIWKLQNRFDGQHLALLLWS